MLIRTFLLTFQLKISHQRLGYRWQKSKSTGTTFSPGMKYEWCWLDDKLREVDQSSPDPGAGWCRHRELRTQWQCHHDNTVNHNGCPGLESRESCCWPLGLSSWSSLSCFHSTWTHPCIFLFSTGCRKNLVVLFWGTPCNSSLWDFWSIGGKDWRKNTNFYFFYINSKTFSKLKLLINEKYTLVPEDDIMLRVGHHAALQLHARVDGHGVENLCASPAGGRIWNMNAFVTTKY